MMKFKTIALAEEANLVIAAEVQARGREEDTNYVCTEWAKVVPVGDGYGFVFTPLAEELEIEYEEFNEEIK